METLNLSLLAFLETKKIRNKSFIQNKKQVYKYAWINFNYSEKILKVYCKAATAVFFLKDCGYKDCKFTKIALRQECFAEDHLNFSRTVFKSTTYK